MKIVVKNLLILAGVLAALLSIYFGSYLPLKKAQLYISALNAAQGSTQTLQTFEALFQPALSLPSPVGGEEVFKYFSSDVANALTDTSTNEAVSVALVRFLEPYARQDDVMHLLSMGSIYNTLWQNFRRDEYYEKAESYYEKALALGPKLPQSLYSLLNLYELKGDVAKAQATARTILSYWPSDEAVRRVLQASG
jgi:tetratricopeptide (TPR) repeat protein